MAKSKQPPRHIFVGGYTKAGTTFLGRVLGNFSGVYARGEMDFFRIFAGNYRRLAGEYSKNIQIVNTEVYDGRGELRPVTVDRARKTLDMLFQDLFFNGETPPGDCQTMVEKSPRNMFHLDQIDFAFPKAPIVHIYRPPQDCYQSLMRHMSDHRDKAFLDPDSDRRKGFLRDFVARWNEYKRHVQSPHMKRVKTLTYQALCDDLPGFVDFAQTHIFGCEMDLKAPLESLSKDAYLKSLPKKVRETSLVQTGDRKVTLADEEIAAIRTYCHAPKLTVHFGDPVGG